MTSPQADLRSASSFAHTEDATFGRTSLFAAAYLESIAAVAPPIPRRRQFLLSAYVLILSTDQKLVVDAMQVLPRGENGARRSSSRPAHLQARILMLGLTLRRIFDRRSGKRLR